MQLITRKSLGGLRTDLQSRVLDAREPAHRRPVLRGRSGRLRRRRASGKRSLEGSFLPGCILTARAAARFMDHGRLVVARRVPGPFDKLQGERTSNHQKSRALPRMARRP